MNASENNRNSNVTKLSSEEIDGLSGGVSNGKNDDGKIYDKQKREKKYCPVCLMPVNVTCTSNGHMECPFCRYQFK